MNKLILFLIVLVFLIGCAKLDYNYSYEEIKKFDSKYGGDFKNEMLNKTMVSFDNLSLMRDDLIKLREELVKKGINKTKSAVLLVDVRLSMLESEKFWYLGRNFGLNGVTQDGFRCSEIPQLLLTREYFNTSLNYGQKAIRNMDYLLIYYPQSAKLFGINENKIRFYYSPLNYLSSVVDLNTMAIDKICKYKGS